MNNRLIYFFKTLKTRIGLSKLVSSNRKSISYRNRCNINHFLKLVFTKLLSYYFLYDRTIEKTLFIFVLTVLFIKPKIRKTLKIF